MRLFTKVINYLNYRATSLEAEKQLSRMTDHELNDIGLGRGDIKRVAWDIR